jgi:A/G-specific adenine glycosylase
VYRIWVSEIMLQQTQVAAVVPYFERFLRAFPTMRDLAGAEEREVLRLWEGLGYYRRAHNLHRAARRIRDEHGGHVPDDPDLLASLPGFGRYTRNAVLSQAFDRRLPILEANSRRVLTRLFGVADDPRQKTTESFLWRKAEELLPLRRVGDFNQGVMELGSLVCTRIEPCCGKCPAAPWCVARREGSQDRIPAPARRAETVEVCETAIVVRKGPRVLLVQRPAKGRWAGLWEFPHGPREPGETDEDAATRQVTSLTGVTAEMGDELITLRHGVTRFRITMVCLEGRFASGRFRSAFYERGQWVNPDELVDFPVSTPQRRLAQIVAQRFRQRPLFGKRAKPS